MNRWVKILLLVAVVTVISGCAWLLFRPPIATDSVAGLARYYGVDKKAVEEVARAYGVPPENVAIYGEWPFPINYIEYTLGWAGDQPRDSGGWVWEQVAPSCIPPARY